MKVVGKQLEKWVHDQSEPHIKDLFGRSAFNRYYYAAFLITREMLGEFDSKWKHTPHKEIPSLLEKGLRKPVLTKLKDAVRYDLITYSKKERLHQELQTATSELSNLLREAYSVRIIADYEPEKTIVINNNVISLASCKLNSASSWADRTNNYCKTIRRIRKEAGFD